jgi:hypothetical protein
MTTINCYWFKLEHTIFNQSYFSCTIWFCALDGVYGFVVSYRNMMYIYCKSTRIVYRGAFLDPSCFLKYNVSSSVWFNKVNWHMQWSWCVMIRNTMLSLLKVPNIWWTNYILICINTRIDMELFQTIFSSICICAGNIKNLKEVGLDFQLWHIIKIIMIFRFTI